MKKLLVFCLVSLLWLAAGCQTMERRIKEHAAMFATLDPETQEKLRRHVVEPGYTQDMVYIALGYPDVRRELIGSGGQNETWIYTTYHQEYAGTAHLGYRRVVLRDPRSKRAVVYLEPVQADVYRDREEEVIRITFNDGRVTAIEQTKR